MITLPKITTKQQALIRLIYRYRFLERAQIQVFLHHKDKRRISAWLKDLREKHYVEWQYKPDDPLDKTKPAIYYLGLNGIRLLRELDEYPSDELRKRYTESNRKQAFIDLCLLLADCCINMEARTVEASNVWYSYVTEADYLNPDNEYHFLNESEFIHPNLCYFKEQGTEDNFVTTNYLFEVFDATKPRYSLRKRLRGYVNFLDSDEWEYGSEIEYEELPVILLVCPTKADLIYAKRRIIIELGDIYGDDEDDIPDDVRIRITTVEQIKEHGVTGKIWEKVTKY